MPLWKRWVWAAIGFIVLSPFVLFVIGYTLDRFAE